MTRKTNRFLCDEQHILTVNEMTARLEADAQVSRKDSEEIIDAWINFLRSEMLMKADRDQVFLAALQNGSVVLHFNRVLVLEGWTEGKFAKQIMHRTGLSFSCVCTAFQGMGEALLSLNGTKAFDPFGWFDLERDGFAVSFWEDFVAPTSYKFETADSGKLRMIR